MSEGLSDLQGTRHHQHCWSPTFSSLHCQLAQEGNTRNFELLSLSLHIGILRHIILRERRKVLVKLANFPSRCGIYDEDERFLCFFSHLGVRAMALSLADLQRLGAKAAF